MDEILLRLEKWYVSQCDGDWEHGFGVHVQSLDNPGWQVLINLKGTPLEARKFESMDRGLGDESSLDWHRIWVEDRKFQGAGDPSKLSFILKTFLDWTERKDEDEPF